MKDTGETLIIGDIVISISKYNKVQQSHNKPWWAWVDWIMNNLSILSEFKENIDFLYFEMHIWDSVECMKHIVNSTKEVISAHEYT